MVFPSHRSSQWLKSSTMHLWHQLTTHNQRHVNDVSATIQMNCEFYNINDSYCIYRCFHFSQQNCHLSPNFKKASNWLSTYLPLQLEAEPVDLVMFMYVKLIVIITCIMKYIFVSTAFPTLNLQLRYNNMTSITATWYQQLQCNTSKTYPLVTCLLVFSENFTWMSESLTQC